MPIPRAPKKTSYHSHFMKDPTNILLIFFSIAFAVSLGMVMFSWGMVVGHEVGWVQAAHAAQVEK